MPKSLREAVTVSPDNEVGYHDPIVSLSNVLTIYTAGNQRPALRGSLGEYGTDGSDSHHRQLTAILDASFTDGWLGAHARVPYSTDPKSMWEKMYASTSALFDLVYQEPKLVRSLGDAILKNLAAASYSPIATVASPEEGNAPQPSTTPVLATEFVASPSLGYARAWHKMNIALTAKRLLEVPSHRSTFARVIAHLVSELDRVTLSPALFATVSALKGANVTANIDTVRTLIGTLRSFPVLLLLQGPLAVFHQRKGIREHIHRHSVALRPGKAADLERYAEMCKGIEAIAPRIHTMLSYVFGTLGIPTTIDSTAGVLPLFLSDYENLGKTSANKADVETLVDVYVKEAMADLDGNSEVAWTHAPASQTLTLRELATLLATLGDTLTKAESVAAMFGWSNAATTLDQIKQAEIDFRVGSGHYYSSSPTNVIFGLTPNLSGGNIRSSALRTYVDNDFDTTKLEWSTITVDGYVGSLSAVHTLARAVVPEGMAMGEEGYERVSAASLRRTGKGGSLIAEYERLLGKYVDAQNGFVIPRYSMPQPAVFGGANPNPVDPNTCWDVYVSDKDAATAQAKMCSFYPDEVVKPASATYASYPKSSDRLTRFAYRVPVRRSWDRSASGAALRRYDIFAAEVEVSEPFKEMILGQESMDFTAADDAVQRILDLVVIAPVSNPGDMKKILPDQTTTEVRPAFELDSGT